MPTRQQKKKGLGLVWMTVMVYPIVRVKLSYVHVCVCGICVMCLGIFFVNVFFFFLIFFLSYLCNYCMMLFYLILDYCY